MKKKTTKGKTPSSLTWETLESFVRGSVQDFVQVILEDEVTELLGRARSERRALVDAEPGYRNGYGKPRSLSLMSGTITVARPRVRNLEERFESRILPLFKRRTEEVAKLLPDLYLHGLAEGDFDMALRALLGEAAPLSASSVARLKAIWQTEFDAWKTRPLDDLEVVYLWVDGVYVKAGLEKDKAALLVAIAAIRDGRKVVLAVQCGHRESTEAWSSFMRELKGRGLRSPKLVAGDGALGVWGALSNVFPKAKEQRCWNHRIVNVLDRISKRLQAEAGVLVKAIPYAATKEEAEKLKKGFQTWCGQNSCAEAGKLLDEDWDRMTTFYSFPKEHWKHLRTTNIVESPFAVVRLRTGAAKRYKKVENATAVVWKTLMIAEKSFRKLDAPHLLAEVAEGVVYINGVRSTETNKERKNREKKTA